MDYLILHLLLLSLRKRWMNCVLQIWDKLSLKGRLYLLVGATFDEQIFLGVTILEELIQVVLELS